MKLNLRGTEREGGGEGRRKEDRHWPPYLSIIIARHIAPDLPRRVIPFVISPIPLLLDRVEPRRLLVYFSLRKRARLRRLSGFGPITNVGKDIPGAFRFEPGEAPEINRPRSFSSFLETRVNRTNRRCGIYSGENRPMKFLIPIRDRNRSS